MKKYRWFKMALISVLFVFAFAAQAQAITYSQAFSEAWGDNVYQCNNAGYGLYSCRHSNWNPPTCHYTGVNVSGRAQWGCSSSFIQNSNTPVLSGRICYRQVQYGPYGGLIDGGARCYPIGGTG